MIKSINSSFHSTNLREKIISYSCGKTSPLLEFYDQVERQRRQRKPKSKLKYRNTVIKNQLLAKPFFNINQNSTSEFEYASEVTQDKSQLLFVPLQRSRQRRQTINTNFKPRHYVKQLKPIDIDHIISVLDSDPQLKTSTIDNVDSTQYLMHIENSFDLPTTKITTLPTLRSRVHSLADAVSKAESVRFPSVSPVSSIQATNTINGSVSKVKSKSVNQDNRIKHKEYDKPFKMANRKEKSQNHLLETMEQLITVEDFQKVISTPKLKLLEYLQANQTNLLTHIIFKRHQDIQQIILRSMEICQEINDICMFQKLTFYLARLFLDLQLTHQSTFFFLQCIKICEFGQLYHMKCQTLIHLSECSRKLQLYSQAIELVKKALVYAWMGDFHELEIQCYDAMGLSYFYLGDLSKSEFFHVKWSLAEIEPEDGYFRKTAKAFVKFYERYLPFISKELNKKILYQLQLPIINIFENEDDVQVHSVRCDQYSMVRYDNCDGAKLINAYLSTREFTQFNLDYYQIRGKPRQIDMERKTTRIVPREPMPRKITEIQLKYTRREKKFIHTHDIYNNPLYDPNLEKKVEHRLKLEINPQAYLERFFRDAAGKQTFGGKQAQIYVRHLQNAVIKPEQHEMYYKRHFNMIKDIIDEFIKS